MRGTPIFLFATAAAFAASVASGEEADGWRRIGRPADDVVVSTRQVHGRVEAMAVGELSAPIDRVLRAVDDVEGKTGPMPYLIEARVIRRDEHGVLVYNRTSSPPLVDRDYTLRLAHHEERRADGSVAHVIRFRTANDEGPPPRPNVQRIETEGSWLLEPIDAGRRTRATYRVIARDDVVTPRGLDDWVTRHLMRAVFDALRVRLDHPSNTRNTRRAP